MFINTFDELDQVYIFKHCFYGAGVMQDIVDQTVDGISPINDIGSKFLHFRIIF